jgi:hypothetical protein
MFLLVQRRVHVTQLPKMKAYILLAAILELEHEVDRYDGYACMVQLQLTGRHIVQKTRN